MNPHAIITLADGRQMRIELYLDKAPITAGNFIRLCTEQFYDGLIFHRVVKDYVIQSGSKTGSCQGRDEGFTITGEFEANGHPTGLLHDRGVISMARGKEFDSASTQFFIVHQEQNTQKLNGKFAAFGRLVGDESYHVLVYIASVDTRPPEEENRPLVPIVINSIVIEGMDATLQKEPQGGSAYA